MLVSILPEQVHVIHPGLKPDTLPTLQYLSPIPAIVDPHAARHDVIVRLFVISKNGFPDGLRFTLKCELQVLERLLDSSLTLFLFIKKSLGYLGFVFKIKARKF